MRIVPLEPEPVPVPASAPALDAERAPKSAELRLVAQARRGDRAAFDALYRRYRAVVHAIALARVPAADAGDAVQDAFVTALRRIDQLRSDEAFGPWLLAIARNRATDYYRRPAPVELPEELARPAPPRAEAAEALAAIRSLPEAYRETLLMRLVGGMTGPEIAERTGLAPGSVRVNLHRGMKLLRSKLGLPAPDAGPEAGTS